MFSTVLSLEWSSWYAIVRKLLTILNAMVRDRTDWQETAT